MRGPGAISLHQWRCLFEKSIHCGAEVLSIKMISILRKVACVFTEEALHVFDLHQSSKV